MIKSSRTKQIIGLQMMILISHLMAQRTLFTFEKFQVKIRPLELHMMVKSLKKTLLKINMAKFGNKESPTMKATLLLQILSHQRS